MNLNIPFPRSHMGKRVNKLALSLSFCSTNLLKTLLVKEKLLVTSNFSFSHSVFYQFGELSAIFIKFEIVSSEESKICCLGRVKCLSTQSSPFTTLGGKPSKTLWGNGANAGDRHYLLLPTMFFFNLTQTNSTFWAIFKLLSAAALILIKSAFLWCCNELNKKPQKIEMAFCVPICTFSSVVFILPSRSYEKKKAFMNWNIVTNENIACDKLSICFLLYSVLPFLLLLCNFYIKLCKIYSIYGFACIFASLSLLVLSVLTKNLQNES